MSEALAARPGAQDVVVALHLPDDWLDLVLDDEHELCDQVTAQLSPVARGQVVEGLLSWRARPGLLSHGVVEVHQDGVDASWHVLTSVVPVPSHRDVDAAGVLARLLDADFPGASTEVFDTAQGRAVGWLQERPGPSGGGGMAVVLALPQGSSLGLLVVGVCLDGSQLGDLAALVTTIATRSTVMAVAA